jgi:hypothetical protein
VAKVIHGALQDHNLHNALMKDYKTCTTLRDNVREVVCFAKDLVQNQVSDEILQNISKTARPKIHNLAKSAENIVANIKLIEMGELGEQLAKAEKGTLEKNFSDAGSALKDQVGTLKSLKPEHQAIVACVTFLTALGIAWGVNEATKPKTQVETSSIEVDGMVQQQATGRTK